MTCFSHCDYLNEAFLAAKPIGPPRSVSESAMTTSKPRPKLIDLHESTGETFEMDAKTLLLGNYAENGGKIDASCSL